MHRMRLARTKLGGIFNSNMATQFLINFGESRQSTFPADPSRLLAYNRVIPVGAVVTIHSVAGTTFSGLTLMSFALTTVKSVAPIFDKFAKAFHHRKTERAS